MCPTLPSALCNAIKYVDLKLLYLLKFELITYFVDLEIQCVFVIALLKLGWVATLSHRQASSPTHKDSPYLLKIKERQELYKSVFLRRSLL